jgi:hypothetical protein
MFGDLLSISTLTNLSAESILLLGIILLVNVIALIWALTCNTKFTCEACGIGKICESFEDEFNCSNVNCRL